MRMIATDRDDFERELTKLLPGQLHDVRTRFERINGQKDGSFAVSDVGYMLYGNGCNLRGSSSRYPAGLLYDDGEAIFGVGYFSKEGSLRKHLHIIAPRGEGAVEAVANVVRLVRGNELSYASVYLRHLDDAQREAFLAEGCREIDTDPWHHLAPEEDESYPNRVFRLDDLLSENDQGVLEVRTLSSEEHRSFRKKGKHAHRRFQNFLDREALRFELVPHTYSEADCRTGYGIVNEYFEARRQQGALIGSTPEDYWPVVHQQPYGTAEHDYFAYQGYLVGEGVREPVALFVGERTGAQSAGLYCTLTLRFPQRLALAIEDHRGFTAIPQFVWLEVFKRLHRAGIREVDAGGSETLGLDDQKRQLGGQARKTHWVVLPEMQERILAGAGRGTNDGER